MQLDRSFPSVVIARDGSAGVELVLFEQIAPVPGKGAQGYYFRYSLPNSGAQLVIVNFSPTVFAIQPSLYDLPEAFYRETSFRWIAEAAIGEYLDENGPPPPDVEPWWSVDCYSSQFEAWKVRPKASDRVVCDYIRHRLRWAWRFGLESEEFSPADHIRLRLKPGDFQRISRMFAGEHWSVEHSDGAFTTLRPTKELLSESFDVHPPVSPELTPASHSGSVSRVVDLPFVDPTRMDQLRAVSNLKFDLSKLIALCEELNQAWRSNSYLAVAMLVRAIMDHVPPIFGAKTFGEIANNYSGAKSFRESMSHLANSARKIGDSHLHVQIRAKESLPNATQVNFTRDLDVLLAEIVRLL